MSKVKKMLEDLAEPFMVAGGYISMDNYSNYTDYDNPDEEEE